MSIDRAGLAGIGVWVATLATWGGAASGAGWIVVLLVFSCAVLLPLSLGLIPGDPRSGQAKWAILMAALAVVISFRMEAGLWAALLAMPWFVICVWLAWRAAGYVLRHGGSVAQLTLQSARCFPVVGAAWLIANRAGWMPFGFDALIVLLTATHFHHAGFTLPLLAGRASQALPGRWSWATCVAVLAGVPLVAAGITATHFGLLPWLEPLAVSLVVVGSLSVAALHLRLALSPTRFGVWPRLLWAIAAVSHIAAMALALGFGLRTWFPWMALPMSQMWVIHGSLNAFGFGLLGLAGWAIQRQDAD